VTLAAAIESALGGRVEQLVQLAGGASQEAWAFEHVRDDGTSRALVMRRDMGGALTFAALTREREFAVLAAAFAAGVAVPEPIGTPVSIDGKAAFFMARVAGEAVGRRLVQDPAFAAARERLPDQLAQALAAIHAIDLRTSGLDAVLTAPPPGGRAIDVELARLYRELDSLGEPHPALEIALRWLHLHRPAYAEERVLVHGDFRIGNVLVGADGLTAVLDWEFAHVGDPYEDVAWLLVRAWRFGNDALEAGGIAPRETWLAAYERASGKRLDRAAVAYWEIVGNVKWAIGARMQAQRHLDGLERSIELASLGRICVEMEAEALRLIEAA
jgi:aminoglycoside phosphotransferase (APT) family kinase protein